MAACNERVQTLHLANPEGSLNFGHAVVVAKLDLLVIPSTVRFMCHQRRVTSDAMAAEQLHTLREVGVVGHRQPAFRSGDDFHRMETENGDVAILTSADFATLITATDCVRGIFDYLETKP